MTFKQILLKYDKFFPLVRGNEPFDRFIINFLEEFLEDVKKLDDSKIVHSNDYNFPKSEFIVDKQTKLIEGLIKVIKEYYKGNTSSAYSLLNNAIIGDKNFYEILSKINFDEQDSFYRIRTRDTNYPFLLREMFHIPFELRGKVSNQRYSINGFPSLYLGRTLYVCWEELLRPNFDSFQAVRLSNTEKIRCLDLAPKFITGIIKPEDYEYKYFMTLPIIACCSVKVKNRQDTFKPEYIIPQLILQWVANNDKNIDGIHYHSTHIKLKDNRFNPKIGNVVLPVKSTMESGLCKVLQKKFQSTDPISWELFQLAYGGKVFNLSNEMKKKLNDKLPSFEIIPNTKNYYSSSILGKLEAYLDKQKTLEIS